MPDDAAISVLLIEDSPTDALLVQEVCADVSSATFVVTQVERLSAGLTHLRRGHFAVVLADLGLPDSQGLATLHTLCTQVPEAPVVVLTGLEDEMLAVQAVQTGVQDYLLKGEITGPMLGRTLRYAIERKRLEVLQKRTEKALQQQRDWLSVTLSSIGDGVIVTDTRGCITLINPVATALTGCPAQAALGRPITEVFRIIHAHTRQPVANPLLRALQEGRIVGLAQQTLLLTYDGRSMAIADSGAPIRTADGELLGAVLVFRDVSAQRQMEEELLRARKIESVGLLAGGIAHDFNNLLTGIMGNISLARLWVSDNAKAVARLAEAEKACERATALTRQLLTFAKGGAPVRHTMALRDLLSESVSFVLLGANVRGDVRIPVDLWPVDADAGQLNQVMHNLVLNAVQAMPAGGVVRVQADNVVLDPDPPLPLPAGRYIKITVQDYGCGIPKDLLANVFDPYFTTKPEGNGLGLSTVYAIVGKHDGYITIASEVGQGTTVVIYLPASPHALAPVAANPAMLPQGSGRILIMDDEEMICDLLSELLASLGYNVECVHNGAEAIAVYQRAQTAGQPFAVVILDHTIPGGMGGRETMARLRALDPQIKAILSSGYANDPMMGNFLEYGFSAAVAKPYTVAKLQAALHGVLQGGATPGGQQVNPASEVLPRDVV
jgi:PAS domain S-box-containing protein